MVLTCWLLRLRPVCWWGPTEDSPRLSTWSIQDLIRSSTDWNNHKVLSLLVTVEAQCACFIVFTTEYYFMYIIMYVLPSALQAPVVLTWNGSRRNVDGKRLWVEESWKQYQLSPHTNTHIQVMYTNIFIIAHNSCPAYLQHSTRLSSCTHFYQFMDTYTHNYLQLCWKGATVSN